MPSAGDEALIDRARAGSATAFGELAALYQDRLFRFLLARSVTRADAEDALQETLVNAFRYISSYDKRWQFTTWLYRIGLRELAKLSSASSAGSGQDGPGYGHTDGPLAQCMAVEERDNLWLMARRCLGDQAFTVLWLRYAEDLSVRETGRVLGRPATWVKVVALRARRKLGEALSGQEAADAACQAGLTRHRDSKSAAKTHHGTGVAEEAARLRAESSP